MDDTVTLPKPMIDGFGRRITYVRMSVTDRCDLRGRYCMAEKLTFLPRKDVLSLEEIVELSDILIARGVKRIRLTGGEPLVRKGVEPLVEQLGSFVAETIQRFLSAEDGESWTTIVGNIQRADDPGFAFIETVMRKRLAHPCAN